MSTPGVIDFLVELAESDAAIVLQNAFIQKSVFVFKFAESANPLHTSIESLFDRRVILDKDVAQVQFNLEQDISIKFNIGTEVFFVKTKLKIYLNRIYFDKSSKIMQLKRRKEPRYVIPKKWNQAATLGGIACLVQDISLSGIRFECLDQGFTFKTKETVQIQFQIYKRGMVEVEAIIHFFLSRKEQSSLIGMEFKKVSNLQKEKIKSVIDDIINFQTAAKY